MLSNKNKNINKLKFNKTKKTNLQLEYLIVSYPDTLLQTIQNNQDITNVPNVVNIYSHPPIITIKNAKSKLYLITMTDPDAPYGNKININKSQINHTYTHMVYLQDMRLSQTTIQILIPYAPPSPPFGIHRYQFKIYDLTNLPQTILDTLKLKQNINNTPDRNTYYKNNLKKLIKYKIKNVVQYKINSHK
jgi:phosphatidylethanolamine-binding protein (PEBP) family uncharacterized protein